MIKDNPNWKQENPRDQAIVILSSVEGLLSNVIDRVYNTENTSLDKLTTVKEQIQQVQKLLLNLPKGKWK